MGLTDDVSGKIGCHHAWADSPVNDLSEVGFDGSVGSTPVWWGGVFQSLEVVLENILVRSRESYRNKEKRRLYMFLCVGEFSVNLLFI